MIETTTNGQYNGLNDVANTYQDVQYYTTVTSPRYSVREGTDYLLNENRIIGYPNVLECNLPISEVRILTPGRSFTLKLGVDTRHCVETKIEDFTSRLSLMTDDIRVYVDTDEVPFHQEEISLDEFLGELAKKREDT